MEIMEKLYDTVPFAAAFVAIAAMVADAVLLITSVVFGFWETWAAAVCFGLSGLSVLIFIVSVVIQRVYEHGEDEE